MLNYYNLKKNINPILYFLIKVQLVTITSSHNDTTFWDLMLSISIAFHRIYLNTIILERSITSGKRGIIQLKYLLITQNSQLEIQIFPPVLILLTFN